MSDLNYKFKPMEKTYINIELGKDKFKIDVTSKTSQLPKFQEYINTIQLLMPKLNGKKSEEAQESFINAFNSMIDLIFTKEEQAKINEFYSNCTLDLYSQLSDFLINGFFPAVKLEEDRLNKYKLKSL